MFKNLHSLIFRFVDRELCYPPFQSSYKLDGDNYYLILIKNGSVSGGKYFPSGRIEITRPVKISYINEISLILHELGHHYSLQKGIDKTTQVCYIYELKS